MTLRVVQRPSQAADAEKDARRDHFFWDLDSMPEIVDWGPGKVSKLDAGYTDGTGQEHCSICRHFRAPNQCEKVQGDIESNDWCRLFERSA